MSPVIGFAACIPNVHAQPILMVSPDDLHILLAGHQVHQIRAGVTVVLPSPDKESLNTDPTLLGCMYTTDPQQFYTVA